MSRERMINHTKKLLKESLLELLTKKTLSKITIKELCDKADINRTTYYRYYLDPYDQLEKIENEIFNNMGKFIENVDIENEFDMITSILTYIDKERKDFKILLENGDMNFQTKCLTFIGKKVFQNTNINNLDAEIQYIYTAVGSFGVVTEWIKGNIALSVAELSKRILELNKR